MASSEDVWGEFAREMRLLGRILDAFVAQSKGQTRLGIVSSGGIAWSRPGSDPLGDMVRTLEACTRVADPGADAVDIVKAEIAWQEHRARCGALPFQAVLVETDHEARIAADIEAGG